MSVDYNRYLTQHIVNVTKGLDWFRTNLPDVLKENQYLAVNYDLQFAHHDASKYDKEEYDAYDAYFYGYNKSFKVVQNFKRAWLRHIHQNPHHWQHWVLINDDPEEAMTCIEMPYPYVIEMICDWWSFSWASGNLTEIFSWWEEHKDYIQFHKNTRRVVLDILYQMREKLGIAPEETVDTLEYHGIKGQKWGVRRIPEELRAAKGLASEEKSDIIINAIQSGQVSKQVNREKQQRHTENGHDPGKSYIYGDFDDAQKLIDKLSGTGNLIYSKDEWQYKERVTSDKTIGIYVDSSGEETESNKAIIVYSKTGTHIYPVRKDDSDEN